MTRWKVVSEGVTYSPVVGSRRQPKAPNSSAVNVFAYASAARPPTRPASLASSCSASTTANGCRLPWQLRLSSTASNCARSERSSAAG